MTTSPRLDVLPPKEVLASSMMSIKKKKISNAEISDVCQDTQGRLLTAFFLTPLVISLDVFVKPETYTWSTAEGLGWP